MSDDATEFPQYVTPTGPGQPEPSPVEAFRCPNCGSTQFNPGFVDDVNQGVVRWLQGPLEFGLLGGTRKFGRVRRMIVAYRCTQCSRLELYAGDEV